MTPSDPRPAPPEVTCACRPGYIGDGLSCTGNLLQVLQQTPTFSNFLTVSHTCCLLAGHMVLRRTSHLVSFLLQQILNFSQVSEEGRRFLNRLSDLKVQSTLFVPDNSGLSENQVRASSAHWLVWCPHLSRCPSAVLTCPGVPQLSSPVHVPLTCLSLQTLTQRDLEFHLSEGQALAVKQLKNGTQLRTRVGRLSVLGVADMLNPAALVCDWPRAHLLSGVFGADRQPVRSFSSQSAFYVNHRFVTDSDILASNGVIHVLQGPLEAPPPPPQVGSVTGCGAAALSCPAL